MPITAADLLNDRVMPFFEEHSIPLMRVLTDGGTEFCDRPERHEYELYLAVEDVDHTRTRIRTRRRTGSASGSRRPCCTSSTRLAFRKKIYPGIDDLQDGTYSWKLDNYVRSQPPYDMAQANLEHLWGRIACPTLLVYGDESWASNPSRDGRARHFRNARVVSFERAGHWVHHDRPEAFIAEVRGFLDP